MNFLYNIIVKLLLKRLFVWIFLALGAPVWIVVYFFYYLTARNAAEKGAEVASKVGSWIVNFYKWLFVFMAVGACFQLISHVFWNANEYFSVDGQANRAAIDSGAGVLVEKTVPVRRALTEVKPVAISAVVPANVQLTATGSTIYSKPPTEEEAYHDMYANEAVVENHIFKQNTVNEISFSKLPAIIGSNEFPDAGDGAEKIFIGVRLLEVYKSVSYTNLQPTLDVIVYHKNNAGGWSKLLQQLPLYKDGLENWVPTKKIVGIRRLKVQDGKAVYLIPANLIYPGVIVLYPSVNGSGELNIKKYYFKLAGHESESWDIAFLQNDGQNYLIMRSAGKSFNDDVHELSIARFLGNGETESQFLEGICQARLTNGVISSSSCAEPRFRMIPILSDKK